jgi:hypothetical protein
MRRRSQFGGRPCRRNLAAVAANAQLLRDVGEACVVPGVARVDTGSTLGRHWALGAAGAQGGS